MVASGVTIVAFGEGACGPEVQEEAGGVRLCAQDQDAPRSRQMLAFVQRAAEQDERLGRGPVKRRIVHKFQQALVVLSHEREPHLGPQRIRVEVEPDTRQELDVAASLAWQSRPLEEVYPILFMDGLVVTIRSEGKIVKHTIYLVLSPGTSFCEWKGEAAYYSVVASGETFEKAAWFYANPTPRFAGIEGYVAFYPSKMQACYVDDEKVQAQEGDFYGGWITSDVVGPFKGPSGTFGW